MNRGQRRRRINLIANASFAVASLLTGAVFLNAVLTPFRVLA